MGIVERKERVKAELKDLILEASKKILLKHGQNGLSIRKIANQIEYSPAMISLYFKDKDEILHELMDAGFLLMNKYMTTAYQENDPVQRIYSIGNAYITFGLENKDWYDLMFNSDKPMKHIEKCCEDWDQGMAMFDFLKNTCKEAITARSLSYLEPEILALQLWSCVHGLVNLALTERLEIVEQNQSPVLIKKTLDSLLLSIFK